MFFWFLVLATLATIYACWIRPVLRQRPSLASFYARSDNILEAIRLKFAGIKQKLWTALASMAAIVVTMHDQIAPFISQVDVTNLTDKVPQWAWPLIMIGVLMVSQWLRNLADKRTEAEQG